MLIIKDLCVKLGNKKILDDFNLTINDGEIHALMGPNGVGKSTLSKVLLGSYEYKISSGDIYFNNDNIKNLSTDEIARKGIFLSMQNPVSIPGITNSEFIKTAINSNKEVPIKLIEFIKKVDELTDKLNLDKENIHRNVNYGASGGERKKNEIFQMLMLSPKLIILDELDSGLDVDSLKAVCNCINEYLNENKDTSVLMITHYPRILEYIKPGFVHILVDGNIKRTGDYNLALEIEKNGYSMINKIKGNENCE